MNDHPQPPERFVLVYANDDGEVTSIRLWTEADAERRRDQLNQTNTARGRWTVHELVDHNPARQARHPSAGPGGGAA